MAPAATAKAPLQIALAGAGMIGRTHQALLAACPRTQLCAVVDPMPAAQALAATWGVPWFENLDALFANMAGQPQTLDGVILATPNTLHVSGALTCLAHGVPVLIEKPVADTVAEGERLVQALAHSPVPMLVGHHRRHSAILQTAAKALAEGVCGRIVSAMGSAQFYKPNAYFEGGPWRKYTGGGPILINLIHEMDNLRFLCGEVQAVQAMSSNAVRGFEVEDTAVINLRFASGALGSFTLSDTAASPRSWEQTSGENPAYPQHPDQDCYFITGTHGALAVPTMHTWRYPAPADSAQPDPRSWFNAFVPGQLPLQAVDPLVAQLAHFCDVLEGSAAPLVGVEDALQSLRVLEAVRQSVATGGREVRVG